MAQLLAEMAEMVGGPLSEHVSLTTREKTWPGNARIGLGQNSQIALLKCCFTTTETVGLLGTGAHDGHLDFHTAPEL